MCKGRLPPPSLLLIEPLSCYLVSCCFAPISSRLEMWAMLPCTAPRAALPSFFPPRLLYSAVLYTLPYAREIFGRRRPSSPNIFVGIRFVLLQLFFSSISLFVFSKYLTVSLQHVPQGGGNIVMNVYSLGNSLKSFRLAYQMYDLLCMQKGSRFLFLYSICVFFLLKLYCLPQS